jgi:IS1 family transposase
MNILPFDKQVFAISCLCEGMSIRSTERLTGIHRDTIMRLGHRVGEACSTLHDVRMRRLPISQIQIDELWSFIGKKQKQVKPGEWDKGDIYTFIALDSINKVVLTYSTGRRDAYTLRMFLEDLRARVLGTPILSSDGFNAYEDVVRTVFGNGVHYGQIVKRIAVGDATAEAARRYSPAEVVSVKRRRVIGFPPDFLISTSHSERLNLAVRTSSKRFARLSLSYSKKRTNHRAAVALFCAHHNWCKVHQTLGTSPAMSLGLTDHVWGIDELVATALATPPIPPARQIGRFRVIDGGQS